MFTLIKNAKVYTPDYIGNKDIFIGFDRIACIEDEIKPDFIPGVKVIDIEGKFIVPGFIDQHVHLTGGGGEGGFSTRTREIDIRDLVENGITTVVGVLGTDGVTRSLEGLYAKAKALELEGINTFIYSGSYQMPLITLTGSLQRDLVLIDKVLGAGEIAIADHRSFNPSLEELARIASEARVGGMLAGKAGVVHLHIGDSEEGLEHIYKVLRNTAIPISHFIPTHVNRNKRLLLQAVDFCKRGGTVDLTAGFEIEDGFADCIPAYDALKFLLEQGVNAGSITMSSDGNGSVPVFDNDGNLKGIETASCRVLYEDIKKAVLKNGLPLETAIKAITLNPAKFLKLNREMGCIKEGGYADMVVLNNGLGIEAVFAKGKQMIKKNQIKNNKYYEC